MIKYPSQRIDLDQNYQFWQVPLKELIAELASSANGLTTVEAEYRRQVYGPNDATAVKQPSAWPRLRNRVQNPLVIVLLLASAFSAATGDTASFIIVTTIVASSVVIDFVQERRAQEAIEALRQKVTLRTKVIRDGKRDELPVHQLVPGDIIDLSAGDLVPIDGRLIIARDFFLNQAVLTGEPYPVEKHSADLIEPVQSAAHAANVVLAGTSVISGTATVLVCQTGRATTLGQLADTLIRKPPPTAFEISLQQFSTLILRITAVLVLFVLAESMAFQRPWLESFMFALALAVGLTPELLPMIVTVTLARGALRLASRHVVIKRLAAIHNLGAMDVLCADKTGTLTEAKIELTRHVDNTGSESDRVFELAYVNSYFETGVKSPLDDAILAYGTCDISAWRKIDEVPFDFGRRRISVLAERNGQRLLIVKGAPEDILRISTSFEGTHGIEPLAPEGRDRLHAQFERFGTEGLRALAIASRMVAADHETAAISDETGLSFAGFVTFLDPPKPSASAAVQALAKAGVAIKILSGDNERVAVHIWTALDLGLPTIVTGAELANMNEESLIGRLPRINIFCRVTPEQKLRVILALKRMGQTVGYLGDGINDAPALHSADVSISVDTAADVAKETAEIILLDKDLTVLHDGVVEGRHTVLNVDKYIRMAISANFGNILSMAIAGLILPFLPLLPIQVLLTNLLYDLAQMGLPFDRVDPESLEKPRHWDLRLVERFMLIMGPISTMFDLATFAALILIFQADEALFRTGWFVESLVTQLLMIFSVRTYRYLFASRPHPLVSGLAFSIAALTVALPFIAVGHWFRFVALPPLYLLFLFGAVIGFLVTTELAKRVFYAHVVL